MPTAFWSYKCEYCGSLFKSFKICDRHEMACNKNPDAKNCLYCEYGWSKSIRKRNNMICPQLKKRYSKTSSVSCEFFKKIDRKEKFIEAAKFYKDLGEKKNERKPKRASFDW